MRHYETMFILKPTLTQEEIDSKIEFFKNILTNNGASITATINMGMRTLAYEVKKQKRGYYFVIYFQAPGALIKELERNYRITEDILKFIVIGYLSKKEQKMWQVLVDTANGKLPPRKGFGKPRKADGESRGEKDEKDDPAAPQKADEN